jgi:hypothetical protein
MGARRRLQMQRAGSIPHERKRHTPNQLLQMLDAADFNLLRPISPRLEWSGKLSWVGRALR